MKILIVGAGRWSTSIHQPVFKHLKEQRNIDYLVCDTNGESAKTYAETLDCGHESDLNHAIDTHQPDGICILVPPPITPSLVNAVAKKGIPFFTEKPPASSTEEHENLIEIIADLAHVVGYNRRFSPYTSRCRELATDEPRLLTRCEFYRHNRRDDDFTTTAVHAIDTCLYLCDDELESMECHSHAHDGVTNFLLHGKTKNGGGVQIAIYPCANVAREHYHIITAERQLTYAFPQSGMLDFPGHLTSYRNGELELHETPKELGLNEDVRELGGFFHEHEHFLDVIAGKTTSQSTFSNTLDTQRVREKLKRLEN